MPGGHHALTGLKVGQHFVRRAIGEAAQHDDDLAAHIEPGIVVEAVRPVVDAVADEDDAGLDIGRRIEAGRLDDDLGAIGPSLLAGRTADRQLRRAVEPGLAQGDALEPAAVLGAGLKASDRHLGRDVLGGDFVATLAGAATLEQVVRQEGHVGLDPLWREHRGGDYGGRHQSRRQQGADHAGTPFGFR